MKYKVFKKLTALIIVFVMLCGNISILAGETNTPVNEALNALNNAGQAETVTPDTIIKQACELLGKGYELGKKGVKNNIYLPATVPDLYNTSDASFTKIDCSGLIYWTLTKLGYETENFNFQNPVPIDTLHWLFDKNSVNLSQPTALAPTIKNDTYSIGSQNIKILKNSSTITNDLRYYQYEENGTKKILPRATIVVSYGQGEGGVFNHSWITLGDLGTTDVNQVKTILNNMGITNIPDGTVEKISDTNTYWRIESAGTKGVYINNADPDDGSTSSGKTVGPIYAFQIVEERTGEFGLQLIKENDSEEKLANVGFEITITDNSNNETLYKTATGVTDKTSAEGLLQINNLPIKAENREYTVTIKETEPLAEYIPAQDMTIKVKSVWNAEKSKFDLQLVQPTGNADITIENSSATVQNPFIKVLVKNSKKTGTFGLKVVKQDNVQQKLAGAEFRIKIKDSSDAVIYQTAEGRVDVTNANGEIKTSAFNIKSVNEVYSVEIEEVNPPKGYIKNEFNIQFTAKCQQNSEKTGYELLPVAKKELNGYTVTIEKGLIVVLVKNTKKIGNYNVNLEKIDKYGEVIEDSFKFTVNGEEKEAPLGSLDIVTSKEIEKDVQTDEYEIIEVSSPEKYGLYKGKIKLVVVGKETDSGYEINTEETKLMVGEEVVKSGEKSLDGYVTWSITSGTINITLENRQFDLALYKWVTTTLVTEDGVTKEIASGHTQDDKSQIVNVSIPKNKLNDIVVKFKYQIKVENQGDLDGYAKEIKDHIPAGLKFVEEDNTDFGWKELEDGIITTDYLKDTLLKHGETAEVTVVLTWINREDNLGPKINYAEISEDYNDYGDSADIDSTPNNFTDIPREDDEDGDLVMLQVRTGDSSIDTTYVALGLGVIIIITSGIVGIKKFVL